MLISPERDLVVKFKQVMRVATTRLTLHWTLWNHLSVSDFSTQAPQLE